MDVRGTGATRSNEYYTCEKEELKVHEGKSLKCLLINAKSIVNENKLGELELLATTNSLDVLAVTESWATNNISDSELAGYVMYRKDRTDVRVGKAGGVLLYIKMDYISLEKLNKIPCELVWLR